MSGSGGATRERTSGRGSPWVWLVMLVLAAGATAVLVLSNDARWLRLGMVAALWAALVGAFVAARYRREVMERDDDAAELRTVYELELEREVAARREYELEVEAETRRRLEEEAREDLTALRSELRTLRENLEALLGGEVLVERVALRAESTRMRSLSDQARLLAVGEDRIVEGGGDRRGLPAGNAVDTVDPEEVTQLLGPIRADSPGRKEQRPVRPEVKRVEPKRPDLKQPVPKQPVGKQPGPKRPEPERLDRQRQPVRREPVRPGPTVRREPAQPPKGQQVKPHPPKAQPVKPQPARAQTVKPQAPKPKPAVKAPPEPRTQMLKAEAARTEVIRHEPMPTPSRPEQRRDPVRPTVEPPRRPGEPQAPEVVGPPLDQEAPAARRLREPAPAEPRTELVGPDLVGVPPAARAEAPRVAGPAEPVSSVADERTRMVAAPGVGGGRRHRDDESDAAGPTWGVVGGWSPEESDRAEPAASAHGARAEESEPAGAHASGRSVTELLAAHGGAAETPRRRRRRGDD
ncbi:DUF6779 domain-containing protein [Streptoalloteichus tenebrarius]|nr:DUF6779 domain-containing protein [Streptoalloteichus tenebrarius]